MADPIAPWGTIRTALRASEDGSPLRAEICYEKIGGNAHPHFSVTGTGFRDSPLRGEEKVQFNGRTWWADRGGCMHEEIARVFPELAPFIRWHLVGPDGPMHYVANAIYWAELVYECSEWESRSGDPRPREAFDTTVVMGAVEGDDMPAPYAIAAGWKPRLEPAHLRKSVKQAVTTWCEARRTALLAAFERDMRLARNTARALEADHA